MVANLTRDWAYVAVPCPRSGDLGYQETRLAGPPLNFPWLGTAAVVATMSMIVLTALASWTEIVGIAALVGAIVTAYGLQVWRRAPQPYYEQV